MILLYRSMQYTNSKLYRSIYTNAPSIPEFDCHDESAIDQGECHRQAQ